ncbi:RagB/SusD family nutrient uptake outer membrane protein [Reichenbachiella sp. MALMAid0571]|uniref:RagB/SusD family nutrient uptake outer membrane protein n=1 Tax=Reichenbachiella sp. MALMAid0571 TaxID=3143939 RepID=UPI0032DF1010
MKNITIKILLIVSIVLFNACNEDFLVETPKDSIFADNLFQTRDGFNQGLYSIYSLIRQERSELGTSMELSVIWKAGTDAYWGNYTFAALRAFDVYGANLNPSDNVLDLAFNWLFDIVNSSNMIISRAESIDVDWQGGNETEDLRNKNEILAHARLFRAWAYRHLTNSWGDVPLSLEEINGNNFRLDWQRTDVNTIRVEMEKDLLFAEANLPDNYGDPLILSKVVAQHYLAELYLTMGDDVNAEKMAERVVDNPNFALITSRFGSNASKPGVPFMDQFHPENALPSQGNTETLWTFLNAPDLPGTGNLAMRRTWVNRYYNLTSDDDWAFSQYGGRGIGRTAHTLYVENLYEDTDDRYSEFALSKYYLKSLGGDTVFTKTPSFSAWKTSDAYWPGTKKWDYFPDLERVNEASQYNSMPYLRLAETYLLLAEAEMKLGKMDEAADHINDLRERSHASLIAEGDVDVELILDERARELLSEEHRRYTLNRFGLLVSRTSQHNKFTQISDKNILFPLPQNYIDSNEGIIPQNPN